MLSSGSTVGVGALQGINSYGNERSQTTGGGSSSMDPDYASDPASGGFFSADFKKHCDLKQMLDSNKDSLKLEAMKRIIAIIARGRDASDLFPAVVKNVVSKNIEVKKLVYVYLVRYAEEQQDLALLSISTFQRALKDPNQLIRAGALRVLSSIRVSMIVPIVMLAIRDSASDMSPYVRKTAAHAIPKLYSLDEEQKEELIIVIEKLLSDRTTLVVGSAVMAFEEVCPERVDLIHKNYRKLCNLLVDVDEWGQIMIINMLTRYARTQFTDPNLEEYEEDDTNKKFYDDTSEYSSESGHDAANSSPKYSKKSVTYTLDLDHRLLLRQTKPLLQSRNAAVVMTVAQLYHHIAPRNEVNIVAKALIRLLRSHKEVQSVVLTCIASMSTQRKSIFEPYMKSFFVRTSDATHLKLLKLEILTNLATEVSISVILREFQTYISSNDKEFVAATIQAIGRCAASIKEVTETCLSGLVHLLSNRDEYVVAESVVVIKKLLQTQAADHFDIISQMAKLLDFITVPAARASILWLIGEYNEKVPKIAPDVLRKMAKTFIDEEDIVKLQVLNLSVKLYLTNPDQTKLLCQYVFNLARYDQNYDIRDRSRFLRQIVFPANGELSILTRNARNIFLSVKPAPALESKHVGREQYQLGSLSHYLNMRANGYHDLPDCPVVAPDSSVRNIEPLSTDVQYTEVDADSGAKSSSKTSKNDKKKTRSFYAESNSSSEYSSSSGGSANESSEESGSDSESDVEKDNNNTGSENQLRKTIRKMTKNLESESNSENDEESSSSCSDETSSDDEDDNEDESEESSSDENDKNKNGESKNFEKAKTLANQLQQQSAQNGSKRKEETKNVKSNLDLLLDLGDIAPSGPVMTPSLGGFLTPMTPASSAANSFNRIELVGPSFIPIKLNELMNKVNGYGLGVLYRFTRSPHLYSSTMASIELQFTNHSPNVEMENIQIGQTTLPSGMQLHAFGGISILPPKGTYQGILGIDFNDSTQLISIEIKSNMGTSKVSLNSTVGELIRSVNITEDIFKEERAKLRGMNEHSATIPISDQLSDLRCLQRRIFEIANVASIASAAPMVLNFAGQTLTSKSLVLIVVEVSNDQVSMTVNCEKMVIGSMLLNDIKTALRN